jgi:hypothetical protein
MAEDSQSQKIYLKRSFFSIRIPALHGFLKVFHAIPRNQHYFPS